MDYIGSRHKKSNVKPKKWMTLNIPFRGFGSGRVMFGPQSRPSISHQLTEVHQKILIVCIERGVSTCNDHIGHQLNAQAEVVNLVVLLDLSRPTELLNTTNMLVFLLIRLAQLNGGPCYNHLTPYTSHCSISNSLLIFAICNDQKCKK